jgi:hypothetical protein
MVAESLLPSCEFLSVDGCDEHLFLSVDGCDEHLHLSVAKVGQFEGEDRRVEVSLR